jgi:hypothetical protein
MNGRRGQLEGKIQKRYGIAKDQTQKDVDDWYKFNEVVMRASIMRAIFVNAWLHCFSLAVHEFSKTRRIRARYQKRE